MAIRETWRQLKVRFGLSKLPVIPTEWGPVTEKFRRIAAENMKHDPKLREKVIGMIGMEEARRRYPEVRWK